MTPSHDFLASAERAHTLAGLNFAVEFDRCFTEGYMVKTPEYFGMAFDDEDPDAYFIWWGEYIGPKRDWREPIRIVLRHMPVYRSKVRWARNLKNLRGLQYYSTERLLGFMKPPSA